MAQPHGSMAPSAPTLWHHNPISPNPIITTPSTPTLWHHNPINANPMISQPHQPQPHQPQPYQSQPHSTTAPSAPRCAPLCPTPPAAVGCVQTELEMRRTHGGLLIPLQDLQGEETAPTPRGSACVCRDVPPSVVLRALMGEHPFVSMEIPANTHGARGDVHRTGPCPEPFRVPAWTRGSSASGRGLQPSGGPRRSAPGAATLRPTERCGRDRGALAPSGGRAGTAAGNGTTQPPIAPRGPS